MDYFGARDAVSASDGGTVTLQVNRGKRSAAVTYTAPAGGVPAGTTVTVTIAAGITTGAPTADLPAVFTNAATGTSATALFAVR